MSHASLSSEAKTEMMSLPYDSGPASPITVLIVSWNRPLYLWACLDSLYRYTRHPARFVLIDNHSDDPLVHEVISGFERRGMFAAVERHQTNSPHRWIGAIERHRGSPSDYLVTVEGDVAVFDTQPCWLTRMRALMDSHQNLGLLGSYVDTLDFVDPAAARRVDPNLDEETFEGLIKARSPERAFLVEPPQEELIDPFNPPGRLLIMRKEILDRIHFGSDGSIYDQVKAAGFDAAIATGVRHRHLSLLNFFDYPGYDIQARDRFHALADTLPETAAEEPL